jgi:hypothetical protein
VEKSEEFRWKIEDVREFSAILNPKQLDGLRLLLTQFPQQQFNATGDRRTDRPDGMLGVSCFDCHANGRRAPGRGHPSAGVPPPDRDTVAGGVNIQRLFGSQRALKTIEDFTEFEQRGAYFDGDHVMTTRKGVNRRSYVLTSYPEADR